MAGESKLAVVAALVANLVIAIVKLAAGIVSGSAAMLAEAAHSFSDTGNQVLLLVGIARSKLPPSPEHPYGTGKAAFFWPFLVAVLLFGVAGAYSAIEGIDKILHPHPLGNVSLSLWVLGGAFVIEIASIAVAIREARKEARHRGMRTMREFFDDNRDATLLTVLVEDALALAALPIAGGAIVLAVVTGNPVWDGVGSLVIGAMLMGFAFFLGARVHKLLMGAGLTRRDLEKVHEILAREPVIERVLAVQSMYLGPATVLLGCELDVRDDVSVGDLEGTLHRVEAELIAAVPTLRFVYLAPRRNART